MDEYNLILDYKNGDLTAFEEFYRLTRDSLYTFLYNRRVSDVDDLFQETFIRFIDAVNEREIKNPRGYLFKIALNLLRNTSRIRKTISLNPEYDLPDEIESDTEEYPVTEDELKNSLQMLADQKASFYEVLHLHVFEKMTFDKIADMLNKNRNTVSSQYRYAIHYLKKLLQLDASTDRSGGIS
jgi:RNA polymerase sigma factor (sigma-70 family)